MSNYTRQIIPWGNSFTLFIHLDKFEDGQYENFDLHTAKSIEVKLLCGTHNIEIPLDYEIVEDNVLSCFVDYRLLHTNNSYGVIVEGYTDDDIHWRWTMMPREGILIVTNTSGMKIDNNVMTVDLQGRVGWGIEKVIHADWAEEDENAASYIENKPDLSIYTSYSYIQDNYATLGDLGDYVELSYLSYVGHTGDYNDLINKPDLSIYTSYSYIQDNYATLGDLNDYTTYTYVANNYATQGDLSNYATLNDLTNYVQSSDLATVATTGNYNDLSYLPDLSQFTSYTYLESNYATLGDLTNYVQASDLATVATTGNYNDLSYLPDLSQFTSYSYLESNYATLGDLSSYAPMSYVARANWNESDPTSYAYIENKPNISGGGGFVQFTNPHDGEIGLVNSLTTWHDDHIGRGAVIEGNGNSFARSYIVAQGNWSHAEGYSTQVISDYGHAEGTFTYVYGHAGHAEGDFTYVLGDYGHAEGLNTYVYGQAGHAEGYDTHAHNNYTHAEGYGTHAHGLYSHAEGNGTSARGESSHAEGEITEASGQCSHAEGYDTHTHNNYAHAEGYGTHAHGQYSHAEGRNTKTNNNQSHAEGYNTQALGNSSHAEGSSSKASETAAHAEGSSTASGQYSHSEGGSTASGHYSHSEGNFTKASGENSHAEGYYTTASGYAAHAEGNSSIASGKSSHASNFTTASNAFETSFGYKNKTTTVDATNWSNSSNTATLFSVGNGTQYVNHNAFEIKRNGDIYITYNGNDVMLQSYLGGGGSQVQSDWAESDPTVMSYILNKPDLSNYATQSDLSYYALSSSLAAVATSGDYNDLNNTPTIPPAQVQANWNESDPTSFAYILNKPDLTNYATQSDLSSYVQANSLNLVATTGDYSYLINTPTIPDTTYMVTGASSGTPTSGIVIDVVSSLPASPLANHLYIII